MSKQEELLQNWTKKVHRLRPGAMKWTSPEAEANAKELVVIWEKITELKIQKGNPLYGKVEKLQLDILRQISLLNDKLFKSLVNEFYQGKNSLRAKIYVAGLRLRSKPDRALEKIHIWIDQGDAERASKTKSD